MLKLSHIATVLLLTTVAVAHAESTTQPASQGEASVNKNLSKNPDNKGLQNASERLKENEAKHAKKREEAKERHDRKKEEKREHMEKRDHDKMERHERMERPEKMERPGK